MNVRQLASFTMLQLALLAGSGHALVPIAPLADVVHHSSVAAQSMVTTTPTTDPMQLLSVMSQTTAAVSSKVAHAYTDSLAQHPWVTKMATGGVLATTGDAIAQSQNVDAPYDARRGLSFMAFDVVYRAVQIAAFPMITGTCHGQYVGSLIESSILSTHYAATIEQTFCNQMIIVPFFYYPVFFSLSGFVQGLTLDATIQRAKEKFAPLMLRNWMFWLPVQYFQFGFLPEDLQIPFLCVAGLCWTCILSFLAGSTSTYSAQVQPTPAAATATTAATSGEDEATTEGTTAFATSSSAN